ncbi:M48 family metalloprotease [Achromobacter anxifer]|uniref:M48 family metalloprotease n=1 Tax=Achromobacter anxifer TaxID=1287737 RepID=UPI002157201D|nr:M48 family metalloprotease [Achromobacter anxifer]
MASPERRLDQLRLADDTAFGLLLVWLYMVLDATQQNGVVSQWLIRWTDGAAADSRWTALPDLAQAGVMLGLAALIGYVRLRRLLRRVRPRKLSEMDAAFDDDATAIARRLVRRSPLFLATPSLTDTNACCVLRFPRQYVIVGGGLRLLWRKAPAQAGSILAHECMHLAKRDTLLLIGTWYTFIAYCLLLGLDLALRQWVFWGKVADAVPAWQAAGLDAFSGILRNMLVMGLVGFPSLVGALVVGLVLRHMMRLREFIADEGAAQQGYRQGIADNLALAARSESPGFRLLRSFHPSARDRLERVVAGEGWARVDRLFCVAGGLIIARMLAALPAPAGVSCAGPGAGQEVWSAFVACAQSDAHVWFAIALYALVLVSMGFLIVHHAYRTLMTRRARRRDWRDIVLAVCEIWAFSALGAVLGGMTTTDVLTAATRIVVYDSVPPTDSFDHAMVPAISVAVVLLQLVVACGLVVRFTARRFHASRWRRALGFSAAMAVALVLSYPLLNVPMVLIHEFIPSFRMEHVAGWERSTTAIMQDTPNPAETLLYCAMLVLAAAAWAYGWGLIRGDGPRLPGDVHPARLLQETDWPLLDSALPVAAERPAGKAWRRWALLSSAVVACVAVLVAVLAPSGVAPPAAVPPVKFSFDYPHGEQKGTRSWIRQDDGLWAEKYPDGRVWGTFREAGRMRHNGCGGTLVERQDAPSFRILIPDKGCKTMELWARNGEDAWGFLGVMRDVE